MYLVSAFLINLISSVWAFNHTHEKFNVVLGYHVVRNGSQTLVNYKKLQHDSRSLDAYISELAAVTKKDYDSWSEDQKLAALINGYNAWTLKLVVKHYPVSSIKKIGSFYSSPWRQEFITWLGEKVSLNHIEHDLIREKFKEPRIHFALVCAAMSCPSLQERPYLPQTLDAQLKKAASEFLGDKSKNTFEASKEDVIFKVSSIFNWFSGDFGSSDELKSYLASLMGVTEEIKGKDVSLRYFDYDWSLNETK